MKYYSYNYKRDVKCRQIIFCILVALLAVLSPLFTMLKTEVTTFSTSTSESVGGYKTLHLGGSLGSSLMTAWGVGYAISFVQAIRALLEKNVEVSKKQLNFAVACLIYSSILYFIHGIVAMNILAGTESENVEIKTYAPWAFVLSLLVGLLYIIVEIVNDDFLPSKEVVKKQSTLNQLQIEEHNPYLKALKTEKQNTDLNAQENKKESNFNLELLEHLAKYKEMMDNGILSLEEYNLMKEQIMKKIMK